MVRKILGLIALVSLFALSDPVLAAKPNYAPEFPEASGTYDVPGHSNWKVKVFVHKTNPGKPGPAPAPACNNPNTNDLVSAAGWHLPSAVTYTLNPGSVPSTVGGGNLSTIANLSFSQWTNNLGGKVSLSQSSATTTVNRAVQDGKNIIAWGRTSGSALGVTYTWYTLPAKEVVETDTIMNIKFPWIWNACSSSAYNAQDILTHELGHWFGLNDHYTAGYVDNTMYGYGSRGEIKKNTLEAGDITGLQTIYAAY